MRPPEAPPHIDVPGWAWVAFNVYLIVLLLVDLYGFNRKAHKIEWREAALLSAFFVGASLLVNGWIWLEYGSRPALVFFTAYIVEKSLSVDNLFVIAVLFGYFGVPPQYQHRVLFWGIFGAILMRAGMILVGVALVERFEWVLYIFGAFLLFTGLRMLVQQEAAEEPGENRVLRTLRRVLPVTRGYHGEHFFFRKAGRLWVTPLFLVLVMIELTDVVFAVDSIPAILGITTDPFIAYSSNVMAVAGLRALYFLLVGVIERVRYLHIGLGLVLAFIGVKMLLAEFVHVPTWLSLTVILTLIGGSGVFSWLATVREQRRFQGLPAVPRGDPHPTDGSPVDGRVLDDDMPGAPPPGVPAPRPGTASDPEGAPR